MMLRRSLYLCFALCLLSTLPALAATVEVGFCSSYIPYSTIQAAVNASSPGDTILVCPGNHPEQVTIGINLTLQGLEINPNGGAASVVTVPFGGTVQNATSLGGSPVDAQIFINNGANVTINNLTVDGRGNGINSCAPDLIGIYFQNASGKVTQWGVQIPSSGFPYWLFQGLTTENDVILMNPAGTETYFDKPGAVSALQYWVDLVNKYKVHPQGIVEWGTTPKDFFERKVAMIWTTTGNLTNVRSNAKFDFGVAMLPANKRRGSPTGGGNFYLFKQAKPEQQAAAVKFIRWITSPERAAQWGIDTGYVATRPDAWETPAMKRYVADFGAAAIARAAPTAASRAAALWAHSASSEAGSLSATIPAPAWTKARPSGATTMVRMAMAVSRLPEKSRYPTMPP